MSVTPTAVFHRRMWLFSLGARKQNRFAESHHSVGISPRTSLQAKRACLQMERGWEETRAWSSMRSAVAIAAEVSGERFCRKQEWSAEISHLRKSFSDFWNTAKSHIYFISPSEEKGFRVTWSCLYFSFCIVMQDHSVIWWPAWDRGQFILFVICNLLDQMRKQWDENWVRTRQRLAQKASSPEFCFSVLPGAQPRLIHSRCSAKTLLIYCNIFLLRCYFASDRAKSFKCPVTNPVFWFSYCVSQTKAKSKSFCKSKIFSLPCIIRVWYWGEQISHIFLLFFYRLNLASTISNTSLKKTVSVKTEP